nr:MazG family protein [Rhabdothermincola salaria]
MARLVQLVADLRVGCPWDRQQTHESLRRHLLEEAYEVLEAIDHLDVEAGTGFEHLEEELGDLMFQVLFHSRLAEEEGHFTLADVAATIHDKLWSRHPHVFGDVVVGGPDDVVRNWEQLKKAEKQRESVFDGIPDALPALLHATKVQKKAATLAESGLDLASVVAPPGLAEATATAAADPGEEAVGAALFALVDLARSAGIDPENALRVASSRYRDEVRGAEQATGG